MEKVEKLLLLVVLGAAMVIMAVMSFGSEDPADPSKNDPNGASNGGIQQASAGGATGGKTDQEQQTVDDLNLSKTIDGPKLVNRGTRTATRARSSNPLPRTRSLAGFPTNPKRPTFQVDPRRTPPVIPKWIPE